MAPTSEGPHVVTVEHDGLRIGALDWGGSGPSLVLLHPTGFCAGLFAPIAERLLERYRVVGVDLRAHGTSEAPDDPTDMDYYSMADDILAVLDHLGIDDAVVVGESLGGGVAILADARCPGRFRRMLLCEAAAFPFRREEVEPNFLSDGARKRRSIWPDREAVLASYRNKDLFAPLDEAALEAYVRWGFLERPDGMVELSCPPGHEAAVFELSGSARGGYGAWEHLDRLSADVIVAVGAHTYLPTEYFSSQAERSSSPLVTVDGGHLFLHENTARGVELIERLLPTG
jgi:pimeloyl-ACP methyl ester carboxylesterase